jgi:hypothetical protein
MKIVASILIVAGVALTVYGLLNFAVGWVGSGAAAYGYPLRARLEASIGMGFMAAGILLKKGR